MVEAAAEEEQLGQVGDDGLDRFVDRSDRVLPSSDHRRDRWYEVEDCKEIYFSRPVRVCCRLDHIFALQESSGVWKTLFHGHEIFINQLINWILLKIKLCKHFNYYYLQWPHDPPQLHHHRVLQTQCFWIRCSRTHRISQWNIPEENLQSEDFHRQVYILRSLCW